MKYIYSLYGIVFLIGLLMTFGYLIFSGKKKEDKTEVILEGWSLKWKKEKNVIWEVDMEEIILKSFSFIKHTHIYLYPSKREAQKEANFLMKKYIGIEVKPVEAKFQYYE